MLINGAAGGVGTFAVQMARSFGAEVTGVCSTRNVEMVRSIGADHVVDYTREDFTTGPVRYDVILDCMGNHSFSARRRVLQRDGICVMVGGPNDNRISGPLGSVLGAALRSKFVSQRFVMCLTNRNQQDLLVLRDLLAAATITPVIDRVYPFTGIAEAIRYQEQGHARGKVVITMAG